MSQKNPREESKLSRQLREELAARYRQRQQADQPPPPPRPPAKRSPQPRPQPTARHRSKRPKARPLGIYVPWWGILIVVALVAAATCGLWAFVLSTRPDVAGSGLTGLTPTFVVITNTPTPGQPEPVGATPEGVAEPPTPTVEVAAEAPEPSFEIVVGSEVTVVGTEGDGLAMRQGPGLTYAYFFIAKDGEVFLVEDGPRENDGFTWWYISDPDIPDKAGWAVGDFMEKVPDQGPLQEATPEPTEETEASE
jgi:hypothetical protein